MKELIPQYLKDRELAWAESTKRSERYRLELIAPSLDGNPETLWKALAHLKPYARTIAWSRAASFWQWAVDEGHIQSGRNPYRSWREKNALAFKNTYRRSKPSMTYAEAAERIRSIFEDDVRAYAEYLLKNGFRYSESKTLNDGVVIGKGSKARETFATSKPAPVQYYKLWRALREVGLKPHDCRKLFATELVRLGANEFELRKAMGWESLATASSYVGVDRSRLRQLVSEVQGSTHEGNKVSQRLSKSRDRSAA